jgi:hypothetical protein
MLLSPKIYFLIIHIVRQNPCLFNGAHTYRLLAFMPLRKNAKLNQAIIEVDLESYKKINETGKLLIGYNYCKVWDAIDLRCCYKCCGYHHLSRQCKQENHICPKWLVQCE